MVVVAPELVSEMRNFIAALSGRRVYLEGSEYARIQGHDVAGRQDRLTRVFNKFYDDPKPEKLKADLGEGRIEAVVVPVAISLPAEEWKEVGRSRQMVIYVIK